MQCQTKIPSIDSAEIHCEKPTGEGLLKLFWASFSVAIKPSTIELSKTTIQVCPQHESRASEPHYWMFRKHSLHKNLSNVIVTNQKLACQSSYQSQTFVKPESTMEPKLLNLQTHQPGLKISEWKVATTLRIPLWTITSATGRFLCSNFPSLSNENSQSDRKQLSLNSKLSQGEVSLFLLLPLCLDGQLHTIRPPQKNKNHWTK